MITIAKNQRITEVKAGKQLRREFRQGFGYSGHADIERTFTHDGEEQIGNFPISTPYFATREEAKAALDEAIARWMEVA